MRVGGSGGAGGGPGRGRGLGLLGAAVVVVEADDVVLAEVVALLHLDEDEGLVAGVAHPVGGAERDVDGLARDDLVVDVVEGDDGGAGDDEPVLLAAVVLLVARGAGRGRP